MIPPQRTFFNYYPCVTTCQIKIGIIWMYQFTYFLVANFFFLNTSSISSMPSHRWLHSTSHRLMHISDDYNKLALFSRYNDLERIHNKGKTEQNGRFIGRVQFSTRPRRFPCSYILKAHVHTSPQWWGHSKVFLAYNTCCRQMIYDFNPNLWFDTEIRLLTRQN